MATAANPFTANCNISKILHPGPPRIMPNRPQRFRRHSTALKLRNNLSARAKGPASFQPDQSGQFLRRYGIGRKALSPRHRSPYL